MPSLWIVDGDAVDKNGELVKGAAIDADVRLNAKRTALSDIDSSAEFQCVVDTRDTRRREFCTAEGHHLSCCLVSSEGSAGSGGDHFAQTLIVVEGRHLLLVAHMSHVLSFAGSCQTWSGSAQSSHRKNANLHFTTECSKQGITLAAEVAEDELRSLGR